MSQQASPFSPPLLFLFFFQKCVSAMQAWMGGSVICVTLSTDTLEIILTVLEWGAGTASSTCRSSCLDSLSFSSLSPYLSPLLFGGMLFVYIVWWNAFCLHCMFVCGCASVYVCMYVCMFVVMVCMHVCML